MWSLRECFTVGDIIATQSCPDPDTLDMLKVILRETCSQSAEVCSAVSGGAGTLQSKSRILQCHPTVLKSCSQSAEFFSAIQQCWNLALNPAVSSDSATIVLESGLQQGLVLSHIGSPGSD